MLKKMYPYKQLCYLLIGVTSVNAVSWMVVLIFYIIVCYILHGEFMIFNRDLTEVLKDKFSQLQSYEKMIYSERS